MSFHSERAELITLAPCAQHERERQKSGIETGRIPTTGYPITIGIEQRKGQLHRLIDDKSTVFYRTDFFSERRGYKTKSARSLSNRYTGASKNRPDGASTAAQISSS